MVERSRNHNHTKNKQVNTFYSNGKLLLTGEYVILDGAKSLAVPTTFGQNLIVEKINEPQLIWGSFTKTGECWFEAVFDLPKLRLVHCTFTSNDEESAEFIAETLQAILQEARKMNPGFLETTSGFVVKTKLTFPRDWGLGSSSTLINNIASWADVDAYKLLWNAFSGSGYDIACAQNNSPIFYQVENQTPKVETVNFSPTFVDELYFVHLNKKQNSREGIAQYRKNSKTLRKIQTEIREISELTTEFASSTSIKDFEKIMIEHERIISSLVKLQSVKKQLFSGYFGEIKSLGAWGGDFVLATGNKDSIKYFHKKGYKTVIPYTEMVISATLNHQKNNGK